MTPTPDVLIVAAFHPELAPFREALGDAMSARIGGLVVTARALGIGLPMAAVGAATHIAELKPRAVILVGTCGAYAGAGLAIGDVVAARLVRLVDASVAAGTAQFPEPMSVVAETHPGLTQELEAAGARVVDVATTLAITVDDATAARIARASGASAEHLEAHGVATACAARGVPFAATLGVANMVGARARAEWLQHHRAAAHAAARTLLNRLPALART